MKKIKGFTLVELLAVIVILAVILVIAVPQIMSVIESARKGSIESTAKLIAEGAEKEYTNRKILGKDTNIKCSEVANLNDKDYGLCSITFDSTGKATVSITGKGKFEGYTCVGNSTNMECTKEDPTDASYFSYNEVEGGITITDYKIGIANVIIKDKDKCVAYLLSTIENPNDTDKEQANTLCSGNALDHGTTLQGDIQDGIIPSSDYETAGLEVNWIIINNVTVKDKDKCVAYLQTAGAPEEEANTVCSGNALDDGFTLKDAVQRGKIPSSDYETAGLDVSTKPFNRITDVVIPSEIDGKKVVGISANAFVGKALTSISMPDTIVKIGESAFANNYGLTFVKISNGITSIPDSAFAGSGLNSVLIPDSVTSIGIDAFRRNKLTEVTIPSSVTNIGSYAFSGNKLTEITIPNSVTSIGNFAFADNQLTKATISSGITSIGNGAFQNNQLTEITIPSSVTSIGKNAFSIGCGTYTCPNNVCTCIKVSGNENLSKIINKTGRSFDWDAIINSSNKERYTFETGSVSSANKANWNVEITK